MTQQEFLAIAKRISGFPGAANARPEGSHHDEARKAIVFGNLVIFLGLGIFLLWAAFAPLDEGVPAKGVVVVESMRKTVTHMSGGTVDTILIKENQSVKAGEVLITLKSERARSSYETALEDYISVSAKLARLIAEQASANDIEFPEEIINLAEQGGKFEAIKAQQSLFRIRKQALASEIAILRENINASGGQIQGLQLQLKAKSGQLLSLQEETEATRPLVSSGYTARNNLLDLERRTAETSNSTAELQTRISREMSNSSELRLRMIQRQQEFLRDVDTQLSETRNDVLKLQDRMNEARMDLESKKIRAPVSGQIVALQAHTTDAAISPGAKILEIVPENEALLIDIQIPLQVINSVSQGLHTDVRISSFAGEPQLVITGIVQSVSSDVHEATAPNPPYYLGRVAITPEGFEKLKGKQLRPGMAVDVIIKTGERSLIAYLMKPIFKQMFFALKEQ